MKILYVVKNLRVGNGIASVIMNYYRELKKRDLKCDFLVLNDVPTIYYDEIIKNGDNIFKLGSNCFNYFKLKNELDSTFNIKDYDIIHNNEINRGAFIMLYAKKNNIPIRITHTHSAIIDKNFIKIFFKDILRSITVKNSNRYIACSNLAGKKSFKKKKYYLLDNSIDIKKFKFNQNIRDSIRKENKVDNKKRIVMIVARITSEKNPFFILNLCNDLKKYSDDYLFWWFGSGNMDNAIFQKVNELNLKNNIKFFGSISDVNKYYSAADFFILPSIFEGFPVVGVEAQVSGLNCFFSKNITDEICITKKSKRLEISSTTSWIKNIIECNNFDRSYDTNLNKYSIEKSADNLINIYMEDMQ